MSLVWVLLSGILSLAIADPVRICVPETLSTWCAQMEQDVPEAFKCVVAPDSLRCIKKVSSGEADLTNVEQAGLYIAGKFYDLKPITTELVDGVPFRYQGIALVGKDSDIRSAEDLRGRSSCHTGLGRTVGWQIPTGRLFSSGLMRPDCEDGDLAAVAAFFNGSCVPGNWASDPMVDRKLKSSFSKLCSKCKDPVSCASDDHYAGYEGTMNCLSEGAADVAFTKIPVLKEYLKEHPDFAEKAELLCFEGGRKSVTDPEPCVWGTRPSNAFVAKEDDAERLVTVLLETQTRYAIPQVRTPEWYHKTFHSHPSVTGLKKTEDERNTYYTYMGDFVHTIRKQRHGCESVAEGSASFCVTSDEEKAKCEDYSRAAEAKSLWPDVSCVKAASKAACMQMVRENNAQLLVLDGGDVYKAGRYFDLQPIASELYNSSDATYYAVAVIRSGSDVTKLSELRGLSSCHTGMGRTAGWVMPVGALATEGLLSTSDQTCNHAEGMADFFSTGSCVPGANDTKFNPGRARSDDLCKHCAGDELGQNKCSRDSKERYSGYAGALRCLSEGHGDVAFVKHTTVPGNTDGRGDLDWSRDLLSADFKLLCGREGGTASVFSHEECNLGKVPSHQVVTGSGLAPMYRVNMAKLLSDSTRFFDKDSSLYHLFGASKTQGDLLFKDSTTALKIVPFGETYENVLGPRFLDAVRLADPKLCNE